MAGDVGERRERRRRDGERADGETVEAVRQVHRVTGADEHEHGEHDVEPPEIRNQILEEREDETRVVERRILLREQQHRDANRDGDDNQPAHLVAGDQSVMRAAHDLQVIVGEADPTECGRGEHGNPDVRVREIRPEQRRHER